MFLAKSRNDHNHTHESLETFNAASLASLHTKNSFEELKNASEKCWLKLPGSVNGTLIYFLLCENNNEVLDYFDLAQSLFHVGIPVFYTFYLQFLLLYTIYTSVPNFAEDTTVLCSTDPLVQ
jgi:hypothetical protein